MPGGWNYNFIKLRNKILKEMREKKQRKIDEYLQKEKEDKKKHDN